jgi:hypothetical protein
MHCSPPLHSPLHSPSLLTADDILIADFEGENYAPWLVTGEAFGPGPACGTLPGQMEVSGFKRRGLVNTFFNGDDTTGTLTSPEFQIQRKFIAFLVGGGRNTEKLALQLLIEGQVVRNATGQNDLPGGSEALAPESWDVREFAGRDGQGPHRGRCERGLGTSERGSHRPNQHQAPWFIDGRRTAIRGARALSHLPITHVQRQRCRGLA